MEHIHNNLMKLGGSLGVGLLDPSLPCRLDWNSVVCRVVVSASGPPGPMRVVLGLGDPEVESWVSWTQLGQFNTPDSVLGQHSIV
jgi:hypothetical protein